MHAGRVVHREELVNQLWSAAMAHLEQSGRPPPEAPGRLEAGGEPRIIHTAHRIGY